MLAPSPLLSDPIFLKKKGEMPTENTKIEAQTTHQTLFIVQDL
jgi:hypothetical protein